MERLEVEGQEVHQEQGEHQGLVGQVEHLAEVGEPAVHRAVAELWALEVLQGLVEVGEVRVELPAQGVHLKFCLSTLFDIISVLDIT